MTPFEKKKEKNVGFQVEILTFCKELREKWHRQTANRS